MEFLANYPTVEGYLRDNESRWQVRFVWRDGKPHDDGRLRA